MDFLGGLVAGGAVQDFKHILVGLTIGVRWCLSIIKVFGSNDPPNTGNLKKGHRPFPKSKLFGFLVVSFLVKWKKDRLPVLPPSITRISFRKSRTGAK